jgi:hypothetical protein
MGKDICVYLWDKMRRSEVSEYDEFRMDQLALGTDTARASRNH